MKRLFILFTFTFLLYSYLFLIIPASSIFAATNPIGLWQNQPSLPYTIASHQATINNSKIYIFGGAGIGDISHSDVLVSTTIDSNGSIQGWSTISNLPKSLIWHSLARKGNRVYVLGGIELIPSSANPTSVDKVYSATFNSDGSLSAWGDLTPLPARLALGESLIYNDKIYFLGGTIRTPGSSELLQSGVYISTINPDGTIGPWQSVQSLPEPRSSFSAFLSGNKIIITGGTTSSNIATNDVLSATINPDGTISPWVHLSQLPEPSHRPAHAILNNRFWLLGGYNGSNFSDSIYSAQIQPDGTPGSWEKDTSTLPTTNCCLPAVTTNGHLYITGGHNGITYFSSVYNIDILGFPSPTPTPISLPSLNVPDIKQYSPPWNTQIYDAANLWSSNPTIQRWGCALTSASMILQYYHHLVNPDVLNNWLNFQPDGYLRNGLLNWLAVSRYTKQHEDINSPTLEYRRMNSPTNSDLTNELTLGRPAILEEPGHFVIAKSQLPTTFEINDPAFSNHLTLDSYKNTFQTIGSYRPTHTDLSYILLATNPTISTTVFDPNGNKISGSSYIENPLTDDIDGISKSGSPLNIFLYPTPTEGNYKVELVGQGLYTIDSYLYDKDGNVTKSSQNGLIANGQIDGFQITIGTTPQVQRVVTFNSLIEDVDDAWQQGKITKLQMYQLIRLEVVLAQKLSIKGNIQATKTLLDITKTHLRIFSPAFINPDVSEILINEIETLKAQFF